MSQLIRMKSLVSDVWSLERNLVSDGFDQALVRFKKDFPLTVHEYHSGTEVWTWIVPPKWTCREAYLERLSGERLIDYKTHPLHCACYSSSFEGVVGREELFKHLHTHAQCRDAIPYAWKHYKDDWALCCTADQKATLTDERYRVVIRTEKADGTLKVGEYVVPGESEREIVLCAHLCHPCQVNDGLSGVIAGLEVMRHLSTMRNLRYTYRLLITPETIGSIAWLSQHESLIPKIVGGLFLEMLGTECPHALQMSFSGDSGIDRCFLAAVKEFDRDSWHGPFRSVIGNDERQWNAPGVRIPMLSLSRVFHPSTGKWPFPEYHSSLDTPDRFSWSRLEESVGLVVRMIQRLEEDVYPVNLFRGEVFCSRYGIHIDYYQNEQGNRRLFDVMHMIDGTRSINQIAQACNLSFDQVLEVVRKLQEHKLVSLNHSPVSQ